MVALRVLNWMITPLFGTSFQSLSNGLTCKSETTLLSLICDENSCQPQLALASRPRSQCILLSDFPSAFLELRDLADQYEELKRKITIWEFRYSYISLAIGNSPGESFCRRVFIIEVPISLFNIISLSLVSPSTWLEYNANLFGLDIEFSERTRFEIENDEEEENPAEEHPIISEGAVFASTNL